MRHLVNEIPLQTIILKIPNHISQFTRLLKYMVGPKVTFNKIDNFITITIRNARFINEFWK